MSKRNENRPEYKKTKAEWLSAKLIDLVELQRGYDLPNFKRRPGKVPVFASNGFVGTHNIFRVKGPGIVIDRSGSVGSATFINKDYWPLNTTLFSKNLKGNNSKYIYYFLSFLHLERYANGTGVPTLNRNDIHPIKIPIPPLLEQKKIAEILTAWDGAIEQTRNLIDTKKRRKKALMQQLLIGKKRLPGFSKKWNESYLGDLFDERKEIRCNHLPLLAITGDRGIIPASEIERKDSSNSDKSKYKRIAPGDIGYNTMRMWQGVSAVSDLEGIVSPAYTICVPKKGAYTKFLGYFFKFAPIVNLFRRYSQGLVNDTLNLKFNNFARIKVKIPDTDEQISIAKVLSVADLEVNALEKKLIALEKQKRGLMQKLLTGEVRVSI